MHTPRPFARARVRWLRTAAAALMLWAATASAQSFPEAFSAEYDLVAHGTVIGFTRVTLEGADEGGYRYESRSEARGIAALIRNDRIAERSNWRFHDGAIRPVHYEYRRTGGKRERFVEVVFDWETGRAVNTSKGRTWDMPVPPGTLDKLSYVLAMMRDFHAGRERADYDIADGGTLKRYEMRRIGQETLDTVAGPLDTIIVRRHRDDSTRQTTFWCAPALFYLPVKIEHRERDGEVIFIQLRAPPDMPVRAEAASLAPDGG